jgi:hypothetical protein
MNLWYHIDNPEVRCSIIETTDKPKSLTEMVIVKFETPVNFPKRAEKSQLVWLCSRNNLHETSEKAKNYILNK